MLALAEGGPGVSRVSDEMIPAYRQGLPAGAGDPSLLPD
jgi:hypothetical protein